MRNPKFVIGALVAMNLLLVAACLFALRRNAMLRTDVANDEALLTPPKGATLPPLVGKDYTGAERAVVYGHDPRPTLVYTFTMECPHCQRNWRAMRSIQALAPNRLRIVYVDTTDNLFTYKYLTAKGIKQSALLVQLEPETAVAYDARAVPQLLLAGHDGKVQWSHVGELTRSEISSVVSLIGQN